MPSNRLASVNSLNFVEHHSGSYTSSAGAANQRKITENLLQSNLAVAVQSGGSNNFNDNFSSCVNNKSIKSSSNGGAAGGGEKASSQQNPFIATKKQIH